MAMWFVSNQMRIALRSPCSSPSEQIFCAEEFKIIYIDPQP